MGFDRQDPIVITKLADIVLFPSFPLKFELTQSGESGRHSQDLEHLG
ncbi:MAG: hypothetical protein ACJAUG_002101 [Halioglobus sp.]|jgi:hypothetical protein